MKFRFTRNQIESMLRNSADFSLSAEAKQRIEGVLLSAAATMPVSTEGLAAPAFARFRPALLVPVLVFALLTSGIGTAFASNDAKPGDALFAVDTLVERVAFSIAATPAARARISAQAAEERSAELAALQDEASHEEFSKALEYARAALERAEKQFSKSEGRLSDNSFYKTASILDSTALSLHAIIASTQPETAAQLLTSATVTLRTNEASAEIVFDGVAASFVVASSDMDAVIEEIVRRTGLQAAAVRSVVKVNIETGPEVSDNTDTTENEKTPTLRNTSRRQRTDINTAAPSAPSTISNTNAVNTNATLSNSEESVVDSLANHILSIQATIQAAQSLITVVDGTSTTSWASTSVDEGALASEIAARVNLTPSQVRSIWQLTRLR